MAETIRLSISGAGLGTDAPTVEDLLDQVRDYFQVYQGVEQAIAGDEVQRVVWRVTDASRNSPLQLTVTAYPATPGIAFELMANEAKRATAEGLRQLIDGKPRPPYFTDNVLQAADRFVRRVTDGLDRTVIDNGDGDEPVVLTPPLARETVEHIRVALEPPPLRTYREISTLEGVIKRVGKDGYGHPLLWLEHRLTGNEVKCFLEGDALHMLEERTVDDVVFRNRRAELVGRVDYRSIGRISAAYIHTIRFSPEASKLPDLSDVVDLNFTRGLQSEFYLERLRAGV